MNQDLINLTKKSVENCKANRESLQTRINRLEKETRQAERELFRVDNVRQSLEAALERLEEADEKEKRGTKEQLEEEAEEEEESAPGGTVMCKTRISTAQDLTDAEKKKHPYLKDRKEEPSAMEKIGDDVEKEIEEDLTEAEILKQNKATLGKIGKAPAVEQTLERGEKAIKAAELEQGRKKDWKKCSKCNFHHVAPWNKKGICSVCQAKRKTDRPYNRKN